MIKKILPLLILLFLSGCAITHEYGPYMGKVVEQETEKPIEGAVVFMRFFTRTGTFGGTTSHYVDAVEVLTDKSGNYNIPIHTVWTMRLHEWDLEGDAIIFKPGYGAFPNHKGVEVVDSKGELPSNKHITVKLPKLRTIEERKKNLRNLFYDSTEIPPEKQTLIMRSKNEERVSVGLSVR